MSDEQDSPSSDADSGPAVRWWLVILISLVAAPVLWLFLMPMGGTPIEFVNEQKCKGNLKYIGMACFMYAAEGDDQFPFSEGGSFASLALLHDEFAEDARLFLCPEEARDKSQAASATKLEESLCSYTYLPGLLGTPLQDDAPADLILVYDHDVLHKREKMSNAKPGRNVLYADGHVERVTEDEFRKQLAESKATCAKRSETGASDPPAQLPTEKPARVKALRLESKAKAVIVGSKQQLRVLAVTDQGEIDRTKECQYVSSNERVADILPGGVVRGKWSGKVTITAALEGVKSNALKLQVLHAPPPMPR